MAAADLALRLVTRAIRAYGDRVLAKAERPNAVGPEFVGRALARLIFGTQDAAVAIPAPLAEMVEHPDSERAWSALSGHIEELLASDPGLAAAAAEVLGRYYRRVLESGDGRVLAELGDWLWRDEPELARTAFERAVQAGSAGAVIRLAKHRWEALRDYEGALALYQRAISSSNPDIAAGALTGLGEVLHARGDQQAAREAWERCIATGNPDWAPRAMMESAAMLERDLGDRDGAVAMYRAAAGTGHPQVAPRALVLAGVLLEQAGDDDGAQDAYQQAADAAPPGRRGDALCRLADLLARRGDTARANVIWRQVLEADSEPGSPGYALRQLANQLGTEGDLDGLRAAHQVAVARDLRDAPYPLEVIGRVLKDRGDLNGWRDAWQQAIDSGYPDADYLRHEMLPSAEVDEDDEPADVPPEFDPRNMARAGTTVLENGLPPLPRVLTHRTAVPMAYWAARETAVVLFLNFRRHRHAWHPIAVRVTFTRQDGKWKADAHWHGGGFYDPFTDPGGAYSLGGRQIVYGGGSGGTILHGNAAPSVKYLAIIQDGREDRRPLDNHFGAWVVRTGRPGPFKVAAIDETGATLDEIEPRFEHY